MAPKQGRKRPSVWGLRDRPKGEEVDDFETYLSRYEGAGEARTRKPVVTSGSAPDPPPPVLTQEEQHGSRMESAAAEVSGSIASGSHLAKTGYQSESSTPTGSHLAKSSSSVVNPIQNRYTVNQSMLWPTHFSITSQTGAPNPWLKSSHRMHGAQVPWQTSPRLVKETQNKMPIVKMAGPCFDTNRS